MVIANIPFPTKRDFLILKDFAALRLCARKEIGVKSDPRKAAKARRKLGLMVDSYIPDPLVLQPCHAMALRSTRPIAGPMLRPICGAYFLPANAALFLEP
jgi:hypothetical protein